MKKQTEYQIWLETEYKPMAGGDDAAAAAPVEAPPAEAAPAEAAPEVPETTELTDTDIKAMDEMLGKSTVEPTTEVKPAEPEVKPAAEVKPEPVAKVDAPVKETDLEVAIRQNNELRTLLNEMAGGGAVPAPVVPVAPAVPGSSPAAAVAVDSPAKYEGLIKILGPDAVKQFSDNMSKDIEFLTKEQIDTIIDKPALLIPILNDVRRKAAEESLSILPTLVAGMVESYYAINKSAQEFYEKNTDLSPYRDYTRVVFNQVVKSPEAKDKGMNEVLELTATEVRKRLRLSAPVAEHSVPGKKPSFPAKKTNSSRVVPDRKDTKEEKSQADYMVETLGS